MPILTKFCKQGTTHYLWTQRVWIFISLSTLSPPIILSLSIYLLSLSLLSSDYNVSRITELSFLTLKYCQNIFLCSSKNVSVKVVKDIYIHMYTCIYIINYLPHEFLVYLLFCQIRFLIVDVKKMLLIHTTANFSANYWRRQTF